jgi:PAS domain S-box-containing protein
MSSDGQLHQDQTQTVLLDRAGVIVAANQAWFDFARRRGRRGGDPARIGIGASYLDACDALSQDPDTRHVASAIGAAVRGDLSAPLLIRVPCRTPDAGRWFDVLVSTRRDDWGDCIGAAVTLTPAGPSVSPPTRDGRPRTVVEAGAPEPHGGRAASADSEQVADEQVDPYQVAFERAPIGMAVIRIDASGARTVLRANRALADLFGDSLDHLIGADLGEYSTRDNLAHDRRAVAALLSGELRTYSRHKSYRRADGRRVWAEVRVSRVDVPGVEGATTLAHFVDVTERHETEQRRARQAELDAAVAQIATSVLVGTPLPAVYHLVAEVTARVFEAENVVFGLPDARSGRLVPVATAGPASAELLAAGVPDASPPVGDPRSGSIVPVSIMPGPLAAARFGPPEPGGLVAVARRAGDEPFGEADLALLVTLAQQVALAVELVRARADQQRLAVLEDRQRIARDLHDTVIQDLIAVGMQFDAGAATAAERDPRLARRDALIVDQLEQAVRRLRGSVFDLREPGRTLPLPEAVTAVTCEASRVLGHLPSVRTCGEFGAVPERVADAVVAVLREGLSNVARHARARCTDVELTVDRRQVRLVVTDDGHGLPAVLVPGDGITNIRRRAEALQGNAAVAPRPEGGTCLAWSCPLDR